MYLKISSTQMRKTERAERSLKPRQQSFALKRRKIYTCKGFKTRLCGIRKISISINDLLLFS